jgi:hypothetical protein
MITQLAGSDLDNSCARQVVLAISATCNNSRKMVAGDSLSFETSIRKGNGSWQVRIGGSGKRPSTLTFGGFKDGCGGSDFVESLRKSPDLLDPSMLGAN